MKKQKMIEVLQEISDRLDFLVTELANSEDREQHFRKYFLMRLVEMDADTHRLLESAVKVIPGDYHDYRQPGPKTRFKVCTDAGTFYCDTKKQVYQIWNINASVYSYPEEILDNDYIPF